MSEPLPLSDSLRIIGLSHHTAPVALRERLAFRADDLPRALGGVRAHGFQEAVILSTCNRVELYLVAGAGGDPSSRIRAFLSEYHGVPETEFASALYEHTGADAIRHLFEVASSLDSQILGETEILAQSKAAYSASAKFGACGRILRGVFERAFFLSKEVRGDGGISRSRASVSSAAVDLAKKLFELESRAVLVVGTGEMATGIVRALKAAGVSEIWVASRTESRAQEFAKQEGGKPCQMRHLEEYLTKVDIVLVSSAAPHYIIGPKEIQAVAPKRQNRTLCLIDISVPRNVDPAIHKLDDTFLYDIDDLEHVAKDGRMEREAVAVRWRPRLAEESREKLRVLSGSEPRDTAKKLLEHAEALRLDIARDLGRGLDPKSAEALARALERLQGKLLHGPLDTLKQAARDGSGTDTATWVARLFKLQLDDDASPEIAELEAPQPGDSQPRLEKLTTCKPPDERAAKSPASASTAPLKSPGGDVAYAGN